MMAAKKQTVTDEKDARRVRSIRKDSKNEIVRCQNPSTDMNAQTPEALICELRIKLDKQAEELRKIQLVLEESRDKYLDLYDFAPLGYLTLNDNALITEVNLAGAMLLGADRNDIINHGLDQFLTHGDLEIWNRYFADVRRHVKKPVCTLTLTRGDGSVFHARLEGVRTTDCDGAFGVHIAISDITDMRNAEEALRKSEEKYRDIFENSVVGLFQTAPGGRMINVNEAFAHMYGFSDATEMLAADLSVGSPPYANPEDQQKVLHILAEKGKVESYEAPHLKRDGTRFWVSITARTIRDNEGNVLLYEGSIIDITERKRAESALTESFSTFRTVMDSLDALVYVTDMKTHKILFVNLYVRKIFGDIAGKICWKSLQVDQKCPCPFCTNEKLVDLNGNPTGVLIWEFQNTITGQWYECHDSAIQWTDGRIVRIEVATDITARKHAEDAFLLASKKITTLSKITRHDINNQLTVIGGYMDIIECKEHDPTIDEFFRTVSTAAQRIAALIQFIGEYEQIGVTAPVWQDCRTLVDTAAKEAPLGKIMVKNDLPAGIEVFADPLIAKVCYNLIDNAVRYGGKISTIRFSAEEAGDNHVIVCEDDGEGVVAEEKEKIFERGFGKNTGIGLALSREILSITGITICETGEPGKGARFEMAVPNGSWR